MKINLKNQEQISQMRIAGQLAAEVLEMITPFVVPGVSTEDLDKRCYDFIVHEQKAILQMLVITVLKKQSAQVSIK
jgi:methionyl aminopeptidase